MSLAGGVACPGKLQQSTTYQNQLNTWSTPGAPTAGSHTAGTPLLITGTPNSLRFLDTDSLSIIKPAKNWSMAGLDSAETKKTAVLNWMILGVYKTRELLHKMKIIMSDLCAACSMNVKGSLPHYVLYCPFVEDIRQLSGP